MRCSRVIARSSASARAVAAPWTGASDHVLQHRHVREQVEALEHDADVAPQRVEVDPRPGHPVAVQADLAALDRLEPVDAAQQGRLAAARRADQAHHLMLVDVEVEAFEHLDVAEALVHLSGSRSAPCSRPRAVSRSARMRRWSRSIRQSTKRVCGIVMITNRNATVVTGDRLKWLLAMILAWLKASIDADHVDQRGVLLQADEVVEQRRDDAPHRLRHDHEAQGLAEATGRASGRPPSGSSGCSRCRRGRPRRHRRRRSASAPGWRTIPARKSLTTGRPASGRPKPTR